jgi:hypothetical protein
MSLSTCALKSAVQPSVSALPLSLIVDRSFFFFNTAQRQWQYHKKAGARSERESSVFRFEIAPLLQHPTDSLAGIAKIKAPIAFINIENS